MSGDPAEPPAQIANPVNHRIVAGEVVTVRDQQLWLRPSQGTLMRSWAPSSAARHLRPGDRVRLYLDADDAPNGWMSADGTIAVNQRHIEARAEPGTAAVAQCSGPCGIGWIAPAAPQLLRHDENCLECAGTLRSLDRGLLGGTGDG